MKFTRITVVAGVLLLAACSQAEPEDTASVSAHDLDRAAREQQNTERAEDEFLRAVGRDTGKDVSAGDQDDIDVIVDTGHYVCDSLESGDGSDIYLVMLTEDEGNVAPLWDNAVQYLCPEMDDAYDTAKADAGVK